VPALLASKVEIQARLRVVTHSFALVGPSMRRRRGVIVGAGVAVVLALFAVVALGAQSQATFSEVRKAAERGIAVAQTDLGVMYATGDRTPKDFQLAISWFRKAAEQGYPDAQFDLGVIYRDGTGVARDPVQAATWFREAADQGLATAQFNLGLLYKKGDGVRQDLSQAASWFRRAAEQGNQFAQFNLGAMYELGSGVAVDPQQAAAWYRKSAEQGYAIAQDSLGAMYAKGDAIPRDFPQAVSWFRKAAEQGFDDAQYNLGVAYLNGDGLEKNLPQAAAWFRKAAEQGHALAQNRLALMHADTPTGSSPSGKMAAIDNACAHGLFTPEECARKKGVLLSKEEQREEAAQKIGIHVAGRNLASREEANAGEVYRDPQGRFTVHVPKGWSATPEGENGAAGVQLRLGSSFVDIMPAQGATTASEVVLRQEERVALQSHSERKPPFGPLGLVQIFGHGLEVTYDQFKGSTAQGGPTQSSIAGISDIAGTGRHLLLMVSSISAEQSDFAGAEIVQIAQTVRFPEN
jgi:uncharacterized protein